MWSYLEIKAERRAWSRPWPRKATNIIILVGPFWVEDFLCIVFCTSFSLSQNGTGLVPQEPEKTQMKNRKPEGFTGLTGRCQTVRQIMDQAHESLTNLRICTWFNKPNFIAAPKFSFPHLIPITKRVSIRLITRRGTTVMTQQTATGPKVLKNWCGRSRR